MILLLYVVDMFVTGEDGLIVDTKRKLAAEFEMKYLAMMHYFLDMEVWQNADGISLRQEKYVVHILKTFRMMDCNTMTTPMALNLKLLSDASSQMVNAMMYHQMIWVLDLPNEHETGYLLCCEHIATCSPNGCKAYSEVPEGYS